MIQPAWQPRTGLQVWTGLHAAPLATCQDLLRAVNACMAGQVRAAYRKRGWAFTDPQQIDQCAKEGYMTKLLEQAGEGCRMWGLLNVNKVRLIRGSGTRACAALLACRQYIATGLTGASLRVSSTASRQQDAEVVSRGTCMHCSAAHYWDHGRGWAGL